MYYAKRTELAESKHYYPYQAAAGVIEMGRGNSFLHLPQSYYNSIDSVIGGEINPDKLLTFCATSYWEQGARVIEKSTSFLGLDVICDWNGGEFRTSRIPFWWSSVPVIGKETAVWSRVMTNGYARHNIGSDVTIVPDETQGVYQSYAAKTQYVSMQYVKLYEQSSNVTYRTPVTLTVGGDSVKTVTSLGHCVNAHTQKSDNSEVVPVFDKTQIDVTTGSDFSHAYSTQPKNISTRISSAHIANTIDKSALFNTLEEGKACTFNMSTTSVHSGVSFFNATIASVYGLDIESGICESGDFAYTWGHDCEERKFTQDLCTGGPCLVIRTNETSSDQSTKATFSNVSAALNIDAISSYIDDISELTQKAQTYVPTAYGIMIQPWYTTYTQYAEGHGWAGGGTSTGNLVNDAYGSYDFQRVSDNTGTSTLGSLEPIFKHSIGGTMLCNVSHTPQLYNGTTYAERQLDTYYSYGDYHDVNDTTAVVFNGDCYISILEYVSAHKIENPATMYPESGDVNKYSFFKTPPTKTVVYAIPLETSINVDYEYGFSISRALADGEDQK